jgi:hypothetical protein
MRLGKALSPSRFCPGPNITPAPRLDQQYQGARPSHRQMGGHEMSTRAACGDVPSLAPGEPLQPETAPLVVDAGSGVSKSRRQRRRLVCPRRRCGPAQARLVGGNRGRVLIETKRVEVGAVFNPFAASARRTSLTERRPPLIRGVIASVAVTAHACCTGGSRRLRFACRRLSRRLDF